ncbi:hypothetical protein ANA_C11913 [Anabaena sp. 90]|nr:hypothetical protein ANA_C11913 [Anabaena sp. 90]
MFLGALIGAVIGFTIAFIIGPVINLLMGYFIATLFIAIVIVLGAVGGVHSVLYDDFYQFKEWKRSEFVLYLLTAGLGNSLGILYIARLTNPYILFALTGTSLPALSMLVYPPLKRRKLIAKYRQSEESLIKP